MTMTAGKAAAAEARFLTISDIATCLNVDPRTVRRWIRSGALPVHRIGSRPRISEADFAAFCGEKASLEMRGAAADALRPVR
jgi:excisionase family DNA binding protein